MVVECGFKMAASNTPSTVQQQQRQQPRRSSGGSAGQNGNALLSFQCQPEVHEDSARLRSSGNCEDHQQFRAEFLSAKEARRPKRVNRSAKLKQCKLDTRREQWLSQGSQGKQGKAEQQQQSDCNCKHHYKAEGGECMPQERAGLSGHSRSQGSGSSGSMSERTPVGSPATYLRFSSSGMSNEVKNWSKREAPARRQVVSSRAVPRYFRDEEQQVESEHRQEFANTGRSSSDMSKPRSNSSCASSSYTGSGSEDNDESHDAEDDWDSAFDALHVQSSPQGSHKGLRFDRALHSDARELHPDKKQNGAHHYNHHHHHHHHQQHYHHHPDIRIAQLKPEYRYRSSGFGGRRGNGGRAWRPDDVSRPPTLPRLRMQQHTYSNHSSNNNHQGLGNMWGNEPASPSYCPICTEELDMTDSSYLPCACGFQLCLFCYHRISSDDGRCPGCRKAYNTTDLVVKVSRSSSVWLRV